MKRRTLIGDIIQVVSGLLVLYGIVIEKQFQAHWGFVLITVGGFLWGLSVKIKGR